MAADVGKNANQLKCVALAAMLMDHVAALFLGESVGLLYLAMRMVGRVTAPIMCFFVAQGYFHTHHFKKYAARLLVAALLSHVPYALCFGHSLWQLWSGTDVLFSLFLGLVALAVYKEASYPDWGKLLVVCLCCLLSIPADWNYIAVLWILFFGIFQGDRNKQLAAFLCVGGVYIFQGLNWEHVFVDLSIRMGILLAIPLLWCYNGNHGKKSRLIQLGFYGFYPLHLWLLFFIKIWCVE